MKKSYFRLSGLLGVIIFSVLIISFVGMIFNLAYYFDLWDEILNAIPSLTGFVDNISSFASFTSEIYAYVFGSINTELLSLFSNQIVAIIFDLIIALTLLFVSIIFLFKSIFAIFAQSSKQAKYKKEIYLFTIGCVFFTLLIITNYALEIVYGYTLNWKYLLFVIGLAISILFVAIFRIIALKGVNRNNV